MGRYRNYSLKFVWRSEGTSLVSSGSSHYKNKGGESPIEG